MSYVILVYGCQIMIGFLLVKTDMTQYNNELLVTN